MGHTIDGFRAAKFELSLRPVDPIALPPHAGSTFRGGFGRAFLKVGCAAWALGSGECALGPRCPYHYIFETPVPSDSRILANVGTAPRPFVIEPPLDSPAVYEPGGVLPVGLILIGRAIDYFPYFIHAFEELGRLGLGRGRGRYRLESVASIPAVGPAKPIYDGAMRRLTSGIEMLAADQTPPPAPEASVTVTFVTPTLLRYGGHPSPPDEFHVLFRSVLRRVNFLNYFHCDGELLDDAGELIATAEGVSTTDTDLRWHAWERYSARQDQRVPMGGFTGSVTYDGDLSPFWPWLAVGEWVHVGKGATFGLGRYRIDGIDRTLASAG